MNGTAAPAPIALNAGRRPRLRLISIDHRILFTLARGDSATHVVSAPYGNPPYTIRVPVRTH